MNRSQLLRRLIASRVEADQLLLDLYGNVVAGYSLRYIKASHAGSNVIMVRRSSDNEQQAFTPSQITNGALTTFCGAGDGFVTVWYDQNGSKNLTNSVTTDQPKIVDSGVLITENGLPAISFSSKTLSNSGAFLTGGQAATIISVEKFTDSFMYGFGASLTGQRRSLRSAGSVYRLEIGGTGQTTDIATGGHNVSILYNSGNNFNTTKLRVNTTSEYTFTSSGTINTADGLSLGTSNLGAAGLGVFNIQEFIIFGVDQSANFTGIETDIKGYYEI